MKFSPYIEKIVQDALAIGNIHYTEAAPLRTLLAAYSGLAEHAETVLALSRSFLRTVPRYSPLPSSGPSGTVDEEIARLIEILNYDPDKKKKAALTAE